MRVQERVEGGIETEGVRLRRTQAREKYPRVKQE